MLQKKTTVAGMLKNFWIVKATALMMQTATWSVMSRRSPAVLKRAPVIIMLKLRMMTAVVFTNVWAVLMNRPAILIPMHLLMMVPVFMQKNFTIVQETA